MSKRSIIKIVLAVFIGALMLSPVSSFAQNATGLDAVKLTETCGTFDFFCYGVGLINWMMVWVSWAISYVGGVLISFAGTIIQVVISAGTNVLSSPMVQIGFKIALDLTNLGFVLAIIMIAFTTMFRLQSYDTKQFLKNLIIAAVLVNFSLLIAGSIIDASNVFGNFFINASSPGGLEHEKLSKFADNLAGSLNIQKIIGITPNATDSGLGSFVKVGAGFYTVFASVAVALMFNAFLVITFYAIAIMLLMRYLWLTFLIIIMPLAWLAYTFPKLSKHFSNWWEKFLHWNIFYPVVAFFLYLGMQSAQSVGAFLGTDGTQGTAINAATLTTAAGLTGIAANTLAGFIQIFVQVGVMLGGLYAATQLKVYGAQAAMGMATGVKDRLLGAMKVSAGIPSGGRTLGSGAAKAGAAILSKTPLRFIPGATNVAANLYNAAESQKRAVSGLIEAEFKKDSDDAILVKARQMPADKSRRAALANEIVKRKLIDKVPEATMSVYFDAARDTGATRDIVAARPDLAPRVTDLQKKYPAEYAKSKETAEKSAIDEAMRKFPPSNIINLPKEALSNPMIIGNLREKHIEKLGKESSDEMLYAIAKASRKLPVDSKAAKFIRNNPLFADALEEANKNP